MSESVTKKLPVVVYAESTPNPAAMKFVVSRILLKGTPPLEFNNSNEAQGSPFAQALFRFPFVRGVFLSGNYVTLIKEDQLDWQDVTIELREFIKQYFEQGKPVIDPGSFPSNGTASENSAIGTPSVESSVEHAIPQNDVERKIVETLQQYVIPAVQQDGGMIVFRSFKDGVVSLLMRGACSGCPSSTVTLKSGIEGLLKKFVPEVKEVVQESEGV